MWTLIYLLIIRLTITNSLFFPPTNKDLLIKVNYLRNSTLTICTTVCTVLCCCALHPPARSNKLRLWSFICTFSYKTQYADLTRKKDWGLHSNSVFICVKVSKIKHQVNHEPVWNTCWSYHIMLSLQSVCYDYNALGSWVTHSLH